LAEWSTQIVDYADKKRRVGHMWNMLPHLQFRFKQHTQILNTTHRPDNVVTHSEWWPCRSTCVSWQPT